jgi:hypothetical protein
MAALSARPAVDEHPSVALDRCVQARDGGAGEHCGHGVT